MKRSQMLQVIKDALYPFVMSRDEDGECPDHVAECVLQSIEGGNQFGQAMMPPFCSEIYYKVWRDGGSGYQWEEE